MQEKMVPIADSKRPIMSDVKLLNKSDPGQRIRVSIYVRQNPQPNPEAMARLESLNSELPGNRRYLNAEEFNSVFGTDSADMDKVAKWAGDNNLKVIDRSIPKRRMIVEGAISDMQQAFGVELNEYEHATGRFRGRTGEVQVPADLYGTIEGVFGLDTRRVGRARDGRGRLGPNQDRNAEGQTGREGHGPCGSPGHLESIPGGLLSAAGRRSL